MGLSRYIPPHFQLLTEAVGCALPADSHLGVCDVHTLYAVFNDMALYPRSRVFCQLSTTPNVAMRVIYCLVSTAGVEPAFTTPRMPPLCVTALAQHSAVMLRLAGRPRRCRLDGCGW